ncbi:MAG: polysaccharide biosynthesis/export family protein [Acidobacteriota bacterium]
MKQYFRTCFGAACAVAMAMLMAGSVCLFGQDLERVTPLPATSSASPGKTTTTPKTQSAPNAFADSGISPDYVIGPEDVLKVTVFDVKDLNETVRVANDGTIAMPLLGRVRASGLTADGLRDRLEKELGKNLLQNPQVSVFVAEFHARPVSIVGAVQKPGVYQITGPRSLIEMLSLAGGLASGPYARVGKTVYVSRPSGFKNLKIVPGMHKASPDKVAIDIKDLLYTQASGLNIPIQPHDIIAVSKADVIYVAGGGVRKPGGFILEDRDSVTVIQALAMAQGLAPNAARHHARIIRTAANGSHTTIPVDLEKVIKSKAPDPDLAANDILYVPSSRGKAALQKTTQAIVQTVSGYLIFHP